MPKHSVIAWMTALGKLRAKEHLSRIGIAIDNLCVMCGLQEEKIEHSFFKCIFSQQCYVKICKWLDIQTSPMDHINRCWRICKRKFTTKKKRSICFAALAALVYQIWYARNCAYWEKSVPWPDVIVNVVMHNVCNRVRQLINEKWSQDWKVWLESLVRRLI
ncbi:uncharacterized protein LOC104887461 [Beta vulgaris subsp. vulgaris]|uniref:uncharacterized protein LOC104887461 n=1 Tax=Beta vulgaris subsp. vulgaris TaxID=3555 RepID=UPI0005402593|nr:uncharacterized protein LOC104887461 [Beta vulgaris subsp. vulgaris]